MHQGTHTDPRPDIHHDHHIWRRVLICCQSQPSVQGKLHYIRCLGGQIIETPTMYRLLQGDIPDNEWAEIKTRILDQLYPQIVNMFPRWRQKEIPDNVLACAVSLDSTLDDAAEILQNHPFQVSEQSALWEATK